MQSCREQDGKVSDPLCANPDCSGGCWSLAELRFRRHLSGQLVTRARTKAQVGEEVATVAGLETLGGFSLQPH